jgi:hypothetical protein
MMPRTWPSPPLRHLIVLGVVLSYQGATRLAADEPPTDAATVAFREVRPILTGTCLTCHGAEAQKGGLDLSRRDTALAGGVSGPAIEPGKPDESDLVMRLEDGLMPPKSPLAPEQVAAFRRWVEAGAPYETEPLEPARAGLDWWSLRPIRRPEIPEISDRSWVRTPVDAFILARLDAAGLSPAPEAGRATLIRRASLDLIGLPPSPEEIDAFVADPDPLAYERLVDRLLASPHYGERSARHWLDVARFGESHGYETNALRTDAWPYRDYVIRARNEDVPFARFVAEQLAGDALPEGDWLSRSATGFLVGGAHDVVGNQTVEGMRQQRADDLDDMIAAVGTAFLGLSVQCARCHDHKFDPIRQTDYYGLKAILAGVQHAERDLPAPDAERRRAERLALSADLARIDRDLDEFEPHARPDLGAPARPPVNARRNVERIAPVEALAVRFTVQATNNGIEPCIDELEVWTAADEPADVALASTGARPSASSVYPDSDIHRLEHVNDGRTGNSRSWISAVPGKGWVRIDLPGPAVIDRIVWGRDREEVYRDRLPTEYYIEILTPTGQWVVVASSADRSTYREGVPPAEPSGLSPEQAARRRRLIDRQTALRERLATLADTIRVYAGTFTEPGPIRLLRRGDPMQEGDEARPAAPRAVRPTLELDPSTPEDERRLALARWIADPTNPLPARVQVNRLWQAHFGVGLVSTPGDFGFQGQPPSHPELLDWLAAEFLEGGGRLKPLHRQIMLSSAYRQSSRPNRDAEAIDADDRLVWRFAPRRLEAEAIRDAILAVSGRLDRRMGGPGYTLWEPNTNYVAVFTPLRDLGPEACRRMIYQFKPRSQPDPTFGAFDCPDAALAVPKRNESTTALQALNLLNSRFVVAQADAFAARLRAKGGDDPDAQVRRGFRLAFGREPTVEEREAASALILGHGAEAFARALFNASEFLYVP